MSDWQEQARCATGERDPDDFFAIAEDGTIDPKLLIELAEFCWGCPVNGECAAFSVRGGVPEQEGIWAGTTWRERRVAVRKPDPVDHLLDILKRRANKPSDERRKAIAGRPRKAEYAHGLTAYIQYRCRCEVCKDAGRAYRASRKAAV